MIDRKVALINCRHGQWIRTRGMRGLRLSAKTNDSSVVLRVAQLAGNCVTEAFLGPGVHALPPAPWTRLEVSEGSHLGVLCFLETS